MAARCALRRSKSSTDFSASLFSELIFTIFLNLEIGDGEYGSFQISYTFSHGRLYPVVGEGKSPLYFPSPYFSFPGYSLSLPVPLLFPRLRVWGAFKLRAGPGLQKHFDAFH